MKNIVLSDRLKLILNKVDKCEIVFDVGTDHGYIPIALIQKNICKKVIASDIRINPLQRARDNINKYNLHESIETRLGNGLEKLEFNEVDTIIIAGMGGILIRDILDAHLKKSQKVNKIILQPMNCKEFLREWIYKSGFEILEEDIAIEDNKFYNIIIVRYSGIVQEKREIYYHYGEKLIENKSIRIDKYLNHQKNNLKFIIDKIQKESDTSSDVYKQYKQRYNELTNIIEDRK